MLFLIQLPEFFDGSDDKERRDDVNYEQNFSEGSVTSARNKERNVSCDHDRQDDQQRDLAFVA